MERKARISLVVVLLSLLLLLPMPVRAATVSDIGAQLICQCGCTAVLNNCVHGDCMARDSMTTLIQQKLAQGQSAERIIRFFVDQYGEQVLASPPKRGFNLMAWVTPFAVILAGGAIIYLALKKWVLRGREDEVDADVLESEESGEYSDRVEKELADYSERSFR